MAQPVAATVIGERFAQQYYTTLHDHPQELYRFYKDESEFCHNADSSVTGQQVIL